MRGNSNGIILIGHNKELCGSLTPAFNPTSHWQNYKFQRNTDQKTNVKLQKEHSLWSYKSLICWTFDHWKKEHKEAKANKKFLPFLLFSPISCLLNFTSRGCKPIPSYQFLICHQVELPRTSQGFSNLPPQGKGSAPSRVYSMNSCPTHAGIRGCCPPVKPWMETGPWNVLKGCGKWENSRSACKEEQRGFEDTWGRTNPSLEGGMSLPQQGTKPRCWNGTSAPERKSEVCSITPQKEIVSQSQRGLINAAAIRAVGMWGTFLEIVSVNTNFYQNYETQGQCFAKVRDKRVCTIPVLPASEDCTLFLKISLKTK